MRRIALLTMLATLAATGVALAVTNTMTYTAELSFKGKPSKKKPRNLAYTGTLAIDTDPAGQQPDIGPSTRVYFARGIKNNARRFPSCRQSQIDGKTEMPRKCLRRARVGSGTATAYAGQPGASRENSVKEELDVEAINGPRGKQLFLVVSSKPGAPVAVNNRVIPGTVIKERGRPYAFSVRFDVPEDLQTQLGLSISLTDFQVEISDRSRRVRVGKRRRRMSYLQVTRCKGDLPVKAVTTFLDGNGQENEVESTSTASCR